MKLYKIVDIIDTKLYEAKTLFPNTLGSGNNKKLEEACSKFRERLLEAMIELEKINKIVKK